MGGLGAVPLQHDGHVDDYGGAAALAAEGGAPALPAHAVGGGGGGARRAAHAARPPGQGRWVGARQRAALSSDKSCNNLHFDHRSQTTYSTTAHRLKRTFSSISTIHSLNEISSVSPVSTVCSINEICEVSPVSQVRSAADVERCKREEWRKKCLSQRQETRTGEADITQFEYF